VGSTIDEIDEMEPQREVESGQAFELPPDQAPTEGSIPIEGSEPVSDEVAWAKEQISGAIVDVLTELGTEIRRSVQHYQRQHRQEEITNIIISGGSAVMPGLASFIGAEVGIPAEVADPFVNIETASEEVSQVYLNDISPMLSIAVGLALRDMFE